MFSKKKRTKTFSWVTRFHCSGTEKELTATGFICCFEIWITSDGLLQTKQEKTSFSMSLCGFWSFRKKKKESKIDRNFQTFVQCCFIQSFPNFVLWKKNSADWLLSFLNKKNVFEPETCFFFFYFPLHLFFLRLFFSNKPVKKANYVKNLKTLLYFHVWFFTALNCEKEDTQLYETLRKDSPTV